MSLSSPGLESSQILAGKQRPAPKWRRRQKVTKTVPIACPAPLSSWSFHTTYQTTVNISSFAPSSSSPSAFQMYSLSPCQQSATAKPAINCEARSLYRATATRGRNTACQSDGSSFCCGKQRRKQQRRVLCGTLHITGPAQVGSDACLTVENFSREQRWVLVRDGSHGRRLKRMTWSHRSSSSPPRPTTQGRPSLLRVIGSQTSR